VTLALSSSVVGGLVSAGLGSLRSSADARREGYAETSRVLIARVEFAYRVRRRTSDDPEVLAELSRIGSDIQERLAARRAWVAGENRTMARILDDVCASVSAASGQWTSDAWTRAPVTAPEQMNLGDWGPKTAEQELNRFRKATSFRFGLRRLVPSWFWRRRFVTGT
jgi:hypothetical protein